MFVVVHFSYQMLCGPCVFLYSIKFHDKIEKISNEFNQHEISYYLKSFTGAFHEYKISEIQRCLIRIIKSQRRFIKPWKDIKRFNDIILTATRKIERKLEVWFELTTPNTRNCLIAWLTGDFYENSICDFHVDSWAFRGLVFDIQKIIHNSFLIVFLIKTNNETFSRDYEEIKGSRIKFLCLL